MKKLSSFAVIVLMTSLPNTISAQEYVNKKIIEKNGNVSLVTFNSDKASSLIPSNLFRDVLNLSSDSDLKLLSTTSDSKTNLSDEKYQQYYKDIIVEFGNYNLHYKGGKITSMNGEVFQTEHVNTVASVSSSQAFQKAMSHVSANKYMWDPEYAHGDYKKPTGQLVILPIQQSDNSYQLVLAYKFDIFAAEPISRAYIYVDAVKGNVIFSDAIMKHSDQINKPVMTAKTLSTEKDNDLKKTISKLVPGNAATRYSGTKTIETTLSGSNYILHDTTRGGGVRTYNLKKGTNFNNAVDFTDADNNWTAAEFDNSTYDNAGLDAHWGVEKTYDYFKNTHNRNSYDNKGSILMSYVHYGNNINNAYWSGTYMLYGDGTNNSTGFKPLTAFDVTAHELGHGVCSATANLTYSRESGALNEGFSDIWGAVVEREYAPEKQAYLIGEEITNYSPMYLRSMSNPKSAGQPDTYRGTNWRAATVAEGCATPNSNTNDNCGVHYNSGVLNHWFYILAEGKTGTNDIASTYNVTGIGMTKAAKITYRVETVYLTASSDYLNTRNYAILAAVDLYGANSLEAIAVQDAFYAVGVGAKYTTSSDTVAPTAPTNLAASNTTGTQTKLTWTASTDANGIMGYKIVKDGTEIAFTTSPTAQITGLSPNTNYTFKVKAYDNNYNSTESNTVNVTTLNQLVYCSSQGNSTTDERIGKVTLGAINNTSTGTAGYEDFTYLSTDVTTGQNYTITITPSWPGTVYDEAYTVSIDYNKDGDFADAGELVWSKTGSKTTPVSGTFTIPGAAAIGSTTMRVAMKYVSSSDPNPATPCETFPYGQVEDYSVNILSGTLSVTNINTEKKIIIYPNPVKDIINISSETSGELEYKITDIAGRLISKGKTADKKINIQTLKTGNFILELTDRAGQKTTEKIIKK